MLLSSILYVLLSLIYRGKTSEMSRAWSHAFVNLCHNSFKTKGRLVWIMDQNGGKFERFKTSKKVAFYPNQFFFSHVPFNLQSVYFDLWLLKHFYLRYTCTALHLTMETLIELNKTVQSLLGEFYYPISYMMGTKICLSLYPAEYLSIKCTSTHEIWVGILFPRSRRYVGGHAILP